MYIRGVAVIVMLISLGLVRPARTLAFERGFPNTSLPQTQELLRTVSKPSRRVDHTDRLIVKHNNPAIAMAATLSSGTVRTLSAMAGVTLKHHRAMSGGGQVYKLPQRMTLDDALAIARKLSEDPTVEYAVPDRIMTLAQIPNDPLYANQWHYKYPTTDNETACINLPAAWDITTGSSSVVIG